MSFTNNASNLTGKSTTNAFNVIADSLTVNKNTLCKGDLTVLGTTNIGNVTLENGYVNNLTVNNFTATNPVPITSGGTGLATIGAPNQVLTVNPGGTALIYAPPGLINPAVITGTGFTGNPTLTLGLEADTGSLGRGFIRTGPAAVSGLCLGTSSATVLRLWSNFSTDSNAEIINTNANFTYNSTGSSGVFQVINGGGGISFTNSGIGTISMATSAGTISMATGAGAISLTTGIGATSITTGAGPINLTTGTGNINLNTAAAGIISITTATAGAINVGALGLGAVNLFGSAITLAAPVIYIGTAISPPIPSILTFACGAINGFTGAWDLTTLAFQLNATSIQLNSTLTIALNNNTTIGGFLSAVGNVIANSSNVASSTALNPGVYVFNNIPTTETYGMDLGYNSTSTRYRTRIFAPPAGDIAFSTGFSGSTQSSYTDRLIIRGDSGNVQVINGNIFTNQNIIGGLEIINNGNLALSATSPGLILIRGGSGSIITLPDATTLIVGYTYTINNNSNHTATVNYHNSGTLGSVPSLNAATVTCIATNSANGMWDIHITGPTAGTDWATPGQIGSAVPNTGSFTTLAVNGNNLASTTTVNPQFYVYNVGSIKYGMDLGFNSTSTRFRTRIFCPSGADIALSSGSGTNQSDYTDHLIVNGNTGDVTMISPSTTITGTTTTINGSSSALTSSLLTVNNTATAATSNIASFLQSTLGTNQTVNIMLGKSLSADGCAQLQYSYNPIDSAVSSTWGFYGLGFDGRIRLRPNQVFTEHISLYGRTRIYGDLVVDGSISNCRNSSTIYGYSSETQASINQFTNVNFITVFRQIGSGLNWIDQNTGFRNDTGINLLVNVSFACKRSTNAFGITAIRILGGAGEGLGVQDVSGEDAVSISGNTFLTPGQTVKCQIYQNIQSPTVPYKDIVVSINTTAVIP